jgi:hypothetical protein
MKMQTFRYFRKRSPERIKLFNWLRLANSFSLSIWLSFDNWSDKAFCESSANLISYYQRHLSHRKGYVCAHRIAYGGASCSEYIRGLFLSGIPPIKVARLSRQRFVACKDANLSLKSLMAGIEPTTTCCCLLI